MPATFLGWERLLIRGYGRDDRIVYGTGAARLTPAGTMRRRHTGQEFTLAVECLRRGALASGGAVGANPG